LSADQHFLSIRELPDHHRPSCLVLLQVDQQLADCPRFR
jgi:hypothetical protein